MTEVLTTTLLLAIGIATSYGPGVMDEVVANRTAWGQLPAASHRGYVALADCDHIGRRVGLEMPGGVWMGPMLVADCGAAHDQEYLKRIGFAVDLSYELAVELGVPRPGLWKVWSRRPTVPHVRGERWKRAN